MQQAFYLIVYPDSRFKQSSIMLSTFVSLLGKTCSCEHNSMQMCLGRRFPQRHFMIFTRSN